MPLQRPAGICHSNSRGQDLYQPPNLQGDRWQGLLQPHRENGQEAQYRTTSPGHLVFSRSCPAQAGAERERTLLEKPVCWALSRVLKSLTHYASGYFTPCVDLGFSERRSKTRTFGRPRNYKRVKQKVGKVCTNMNRFHCEQLGFNPAKTL